MAIFTEDANYLKCLGYFTNVLGFKIPDNDTSSIIDVNYTGDEIELSPSDWGGDTTLTINNRNVAIAQNLWFVFSKAKAWDGNDFFNNIVDDEHPPLPISNSPKSYDGKELWFRYPTAFNSLTVTELQDDTAGQNSFNLFVNMGTKTSISKDTSEFFGIKRLLELNPSNANCISLAKYNGEGDESNPDNYTMCTNNLMVKTYKPNSIIFKISYDTGDFGSKTNGNEYTLRQIGLVNALRVNRAFINYFLPTGNLNSFYNGMTLGSHINVMLNEIFSFGDRTTDKLSLQKYITDGNKLVTNVDDSIDTPWSVLHFYENMSPNYRFSYQKDIYTFILTFENQKKCDCDCDNCNC